MQHETTLEKVYDKVIGRVKDALLKAGADKEYVFKYQNEVMSGDYNNLLCVTMDYVYVT